ncbi:hypothetical protein KAR91_40225 [Candidatus Pacearchaeota archaeon]|nr:hypothetical protein [Candidatus Pacearchaeota archaeon]
MKVKEYKKEYQDFSSKLSDNTRKLAFAGIAIVWVFKQAKNGIFILPNLLKLAMLMFVITLSFDLLQYTYQTALWGLFHRHYEKKFGEDYELTAPKYFNWPSISFFWLKVIALVAGYVVMLKFLL